MVDTIKFSQMTNAGNINNNDIMPSLRSGENVILNNPWTFLPPGTTAERPTPSATVNYRLRFNTEDQLYEYYDAVLMMWTQIQESAFTVGPFITYTADASLPDAQNLGALANGILKQTITLGVATLDIAVNGTDFYGPGFVIPGTDGGTGVNNGALTINLGTATTGFVLTSDSSGNATWQAVSASGAITTIDGDSGSVTPLAGVVTISGASTGLTFTGASQTLSLGGLLNTTFGGSGVSNPTAHGIMIGEGASPMTPIVLGAGQVLIGTTASDPVAATLTYANGILISSASGSITVNLAPIADHTLLANISGGALAPSSTTLTALIDNAIGSTQGNILYRNASDWVVLAPGTMGQFLTTGGAAANVSWTSQVAPTGQALSEVNDTNVTMTLGGSPTTALLAATSMTLGWTGLLAFSRGGTNVASTPTTASASNFAAWDANVNLPANNFIAGYTTTATAAGNTTLTVASTSSQFFTGSTTQTVTLPVTSTLTLGHHFYVVNNSSGAVTINSSGGNAIQVMAAGTTCNLTCILTSGTTAASWYAEYAFQSGSSTGTVNSGLINQLAWYAANGTAVSGLATANSSGLLTNGSGVPAWVAYTGTGSPVLNTSPTITTPLIGQINEPSNNLAALSITGVTSAVNHVNIANSATLNNPVISATGTDTNIILAIIGKGTGGVALGGNTSGTAYASGYQGEIISAKTAAWDSISLASGTGTNITSITLTPGVWNIYSHVTFVPTATTTYTGATSAGVNTVSGTMPNVTVPSLSAPSAYNEQFVTTGKACQLTLPTGTVNISTSVTYYLVAQPNFAVSTMKGGGIIWAQRTN